MNFELLPFSKPSKFKVNCSIGEGQLVSFTVIGPTEKLLPSKDDQDLWRGTCFELFVKDKDQDHYEEINVGLKGLSHVYDFESYRKRSICPPAITVKKINFKKEQCSLCLSFEVGNVTLKEKKLGISAIIFTGDETEYFALHHFGDRPDFHSF